MITIRQFPYPYQAALAICSDLDETPDRETYFRIAKFLNSAAITPMGRGIDIEFGNSIYFNMPKDQFAYWNTDEEGKEMIHTLIQSGHIDCLHSFGDLATTRIQAEEAINELEKHNSKIKVWVDHSKAPTNFSSDIMNGFGDVVNAPPYHADITTNYGIEYISRGRVTSLIAQEVPAKFTDILDKTHPAASAKKLTKEVAKHLLAYAGSTKYKIHKPNKILQKIKLRDGTEIYEFLRCNPHFAGVSGGTTAAGIAEVLTKKNLEKLIRQKGACILYTHLGKIANYDIPFPQQTVQAFRRLAKFQKKQKILITTTFRLLQYLKTRDIIRISSESNESHTRIKITNINDPNHLQGITFITNEKNKDFSVTMPDNSPIISKTYHLANKSIIQIPWTKLQFPDI